MFGASHRARARAKDEGEKPFWISFSDLMTSLMVLFLVAMAVALMAVTQGLQQIKDQSEKRDDEIASCMNDVGAVVAKFKDVSIKGNNTIDFGSLAEFKKDDDDLDRGKRDFLRGFVPRVLDVARHPSCERWLKKVLVEGFASQEGSYLYNLNLSLQRSQRVLCALLDSKAANAIAENDRKLIRKLFLVGGSSFNSVKVSPEQSRRVELRLEFRELGKKEPPPPEIPWDEDAKCPIVSKNAARS